MPQSVSNCFYIRIFEQLIAFMKQENTYIVPFEIALTLEGGYYRLNITHPEFKGRIRKRIGNGNQERHETLISHLKVELENHFIEIQISKEAVDSFVNYYIDMFYKKTASIFDFFPEFLKSKQETFNEKTEKFLTKASLRTYERATNTFKKYLASKNIKPYPGNISKDVLDGYFHYLKLGYNYRVKLHGKFKEFVKYLAKAKRFPINPTYELSVFSEKYDNQDPKKHDIALSKKQIDKLIQFREHLLSGNVKLKEYKTCKTISEGLQNYQRTTKYNNLILSLDCFLFMVATGQYHADIEKITLSISRTKDNNKHCSYRRAKNNSKCKGIPIADYGVFIGENLINQYKIDNGENFPYPLTLNTLDKHLREISRLAGLDIKITSKMGRKTFASRLYYDHNLDIKHIQVLLGHKSIKDTYNYLRIEDDEIANTIHRELGVTDC